MQFAGIEKHPPTWDDQLSYLDSIAVACSLLRHSILTAKAHKKIGIDKESFKKQKAPH